MAELATKVDLATKADLRATTADLEAAFEALTWRLTVRLGGILIAGLIAIGLLIVASAPSPIS